MLRIAQRTRARIRYTLTDENGDPAEPAGAVAVTVEDSAGTEVAAGEATAVVGEPGAYSFAFAAPSALGILTADWQATIDATVQHFETVHEVVSHHVALIADLRRLEPLDDAEKYPAWLVEYGRDLATYALEDACNTAFARRVHTDTLGELGKYALLSKTRDVELKTFTHGLPATELDLTADPVGFGFRVGRGGLILGGAVRINAPLTIAYEHGYRRTPPRVARAVALLAREWLQENVDEAIPPRATSVDSDAGTMRLVTAGEFGRGFDIPEVNAVVQAYGE